MDIGTSCNKPGCRRNSNWRGPPIPVDLEMQEKRGAGDKLFRYLRHYPLYCPRIAEVDCGDIDVEETVAVPPLLSAEDCLLMYRRALGDSSVVAGTDLGSASKQPFGVISSAQRHRSRREIGPKELRTEKSAFVKEEKSKVKDTENNFVACATITPTLNAEYDEIESNEVDIQVTEIALSLRDPVSLSRLELPCKGIYCEHLQCFDLEVYRTINKQRLRHSSQFRCPLCDLHCPPGIIFVDQLAARLLVHFNEESKVDGILVRREGEGLFLIAMPPEKDLVHGAKNCGIAENPPVSATTLLSLPPDDLKMKTQLTHITSLPALYLTTTLDDLLDVLNTYPTSHLMAIWSISQLSCEHILMQKPFYSATYQGLRHALQVVPGIGAMTARRLVDRLYEYIDRIKQGKYLVDSEDLPETSSTTTIEAGTGNFLATKELKSKVIRKRSTTVESGTSSRCDADLFCHEGITGNGNNNDASSVSAVGITSCTALDEENSIFTSIKECHSDKPMNENTLQNKRATDSDGTEAFFIHEPLADLNTHLQTMAEEKMKKLAERTKSIAVSTAAIARRIPSKSIINVGLESVTKGSIGEEASQNSELLQVAAVVNVPPAESADATLHIPPVAAYDLHTHVLLPSPLGLYTFFNPYHGPTPGREYSFPQFAPYRYSMRVTRGFQVDSSFLPQPRAKISRSSFTATKCAENNEPRRKKNRVYKTDATMALLMTNFTE